MMSDKLSRRERKKLETRQNLMEAAMRLFCDHGYDATTVEDITEAADVAKGTFFNYFPTKDAVLPAIAADRLQQLEDALTPERGAPDSAVVRIKLALRLMADDPLCDPRLVRRLFAAVTRRREPNPGHAIRDLLIEQVRQAQETGEMRGDFDPVYLGSLIRSLFFQLLMMWHHGHRPAPLPEMLDAAIDLLMDGAGGPAWRSQ
jgi:TetR/AcrR family transcriptional regulator, cholesterol catabolism regulator